jgi:hypothetical protein
MMADLDEAAVFDAGIRQIETTDPVVGGAPNISTGAGMANIPHQQLARRTLWLKDRIENDLDVDGTTAVRGLLRLATTTEARAGTNSAKALTPAAAADAFLRREVGTDSALDAGDNLDTITTPGIYRWLASSPVNAPSFLTQYAQMLVEIDGSQPTQMVWGGIDGRVAVRRRTSGVWGAWNRMWSDADGAAVLALSGKQELPSGLEIKWIQNAQVATANVPSARVLFPEAFATACAVIVGTHDGAEGLVNTIVQSVDRFGFNWISNFTNPVPQTHYFIAIGY